MRFILVLILAVVNSQVASQSKISYAKESSCVLKILNKTSQAITIVVRSAPFLNNFNLKNESTSVDTEIFIIVPENVSRMKQILIRGEMLDLFFSPMDTTIVTFNEKGMEFEGKFGSINRYLNDPVNREARSRMLSWKNSKRLSASSYASKLDSTLRVMRINLEKAKLPNWYVSYRTQELVYANGYDKLFYVANRDINPNLGKVLDNYFDFLSSIPILNEDARSVPVYYDFLDCYFFHLTEMNWEVRSPGYLALSYTNKQEIREKLDGGKDSADVKYWTSGLRLAKKMLRGDVLELFGYRTAMINAFLISGLDNAAFASIRYYNDNFENRVLQEMLDELISRKIKKLKEPKIDFEFLESSGRSMKLSDFKKKIVILNFWTMGCGPCKFEEPFERDLLKSLDSTKVEFISICMYESDFGRIKLRKVPGRVVIPKRTDYDAIAKSFSVVFYPRYLVLVDNKIVISDAPKPSSGKLYSLVKGLSK